MAEDVFRRLREAAARAFEGEPVAFAYLFGSQATGKTHPRSDVDVAVYVEESVPKDRYLDLQLKLPRALENAHAGSVEVLVVNEMSLPLKGRVVRGGKLLYSRDEPARVRFESRTLDDFLDFEIHARPLNQALLRGIAEGRPLMVDPERVNALLERLGREVSRLRKSAKRSPDDLVRDVDAMDAIKYRLVVAVEICIDLGEHIIASEGLRAPDSFAAVFAILGEGGYLEAGLADSLSDMARFRNLLVHVYQRVDDRRVVEILKTRLGDFDAYREHIARAVTS
jgi:uncharacterized protein YutE (UPF0331/DUF86 family)/predicted nucleotidyltransferase